MAPQLLLLCPRFSPEAEGPLARRQGVLWRSLTQNTGEKCSLRGGSQDRLCLFMPQTSLENACSCNVFYFDGCLAPFKNLAGLIVFQGQCWERDHGSRRAGKSSSRCLVASFSFSQERLCYMCAASVSNLTEGNQKNFHLVKMQPANGFLFQNITRYYYRMFRLYIPDKQEIYAALIGCQSER